MKTNEILRFMDEAFLEKVYGFAYRRCNTSTEAEDLCSQIILTCLTALRKPTEIENLYGFVWTIARRVYADHCEKRNRDLPTCSLENAEHALVSSEIDQWMEDVEAADEIKRILYEISFLSKAYRDVMVMYYIDEMTVKDIAARLRIGETTVKQRLFSARNEIRKEVSAMKERNQTLKPIRLAATGTGDPRGNDPRSKTERLFSQNLIYLCKDKPRTAKELSDALGVPMPYVEEELDIQVRGENGRYGMLRKLDNGKYLTNVLVVDYSEYDEVSRIYEKHLPEILQCLKTALAEQRDEILGFPYLSKQNDLPFLFWSLISRMIWFFEEEIVELIKQRHFADIPASKRPFSVATVAYCEEDQPRFDFYGSNGIDAVSVGGYRHVYVSNLDGKRIKNHFWSGHNLSHDPKLIMLLRSIRGLQMDDLLESEKEIAAKAIECGYLRKNGSSLEPNVIVIDRKDEMAFYDLSHKLREGMGDVQEAIADALAVYMKAHIPQHLLGEYELYAQLIAGVRVLSDTIEACIREGLLYEPQNKPGAEGVVMIVEK